MKRLIPVTTSALVLACCFSTIRDVTPASAEKPAIAQTAAPVSLFRCRIKLINEVTLASDRPGIIKFVEPNEGDTVRAEQTIVGLRDEVAAAQLAIAELNAKNDVEIRYAKKAYDVAKTEHKKALKANEKVANTVTEIDVLKLKLTADRSELQIEQAEMQFDVNELNRKEAEAQLKTYRIEAPFSGIVTKIHKQKGEAVRQGDPILEMVSTDRVRVEGDIEISQYWNVKRGARVMVQLEIPDVDLEVEKRTFEGRIAFVDVRVNPITKLVRVWAEVANHDNILKAGLPARMTIFSDQRAGTKTASKKSQSN